MVPVLMQTVESSNIAMIGYNKPKKLLRVQFNSGAYYDYYDVEFGVYNNLRTSESVGSAFHKLIKDVYRYDQQNPNEIRNAGRIIAAFFKGMQFSQKLMAIKEQNKNDLDTTILELNKLFEDMKI